MYRITNCRIMQAKLNQHADGPEHDVWQFVQLLLASDVASYAERKSHDRHNDERAATEYAVARGAALAAGATHRCRDYASSEQYAQLHFLSGWRAGQKSHGGEEVYSVSRAARNAPPFWLRCILLAAGCARRTWIYWSLQKPRDDHLGRLAEAALGNQTRQNNLTDKKLIDYFDQLAPELAAASEQLEEADWLFDLLAQWQERCLDLPATDHPLDTLLPDLARFLDQRATQLAEQPVLERFPVASQAVKRLVEVLLENTGSRQILPGALQELLASVDPGPSGAPPPALQNLAAWLSLLPPDFPKIERKPAEVLAKITSVPVPLPVPRQPKQKPDQSAERVALDRTFIRQAMADAFAPGDIRHALVQSLILGQPAADQQQLVLSAAHSGSLPADLWPDLSNRLQQWSDFLNHRQTKTYTDDWIRLEMPPAAQQMPKRLEPLLQYADEQQHHRTACGWSAGEWAAIEESILVAALLSVLLDEVTLTFQAVYKTARAAAQADKPAQTAPAHEQDR